VSIQYRGKLYYYLLFEVVHSLAYAVKPCPQCEIGLIIEDHREPLRAYCDHCGCEYIL